MRSDSRVKGSGLTELQTACPQWIPSPWCQPPRCNFYDFNVSASCGVLEELWSKLNEGSSPTFRNVPHIKPC